MKDTNRIPDGLNAEAAERTRILEELKLHQAELEMQNDELQRVNEQLELQQLKYAGVYDLAPIGFYILDQNGYITEVNNVGVSLLGTSKNKVLMQPFQSFIAKDDRDGYHRFFRQLLHTKKKLSCQLSMQMVAGHLIHVQMEGIVVMANDIATQCNIVITDITNLIHAEETLRITRQRLEFSLQASSSGIWHLEPATMMIGLDQLITEVWMPGNQFDGKYKSFLALMHPEDRITTDQYLRKAISGKGEIDINCRLGEQPIYVRIRGRVKDQGTANEHYTGIIMNVTEKTLLETKQQKAIAVATVLAEEKERRRISESLHDSVSQLLYAIRLKLALVPGADDQEFALKEVYQLLDMAVVETRNVSFTLAPSILTDFGLPATLGELALRLSGPQLRIKTNLGKFTGRLDMQLETVIFRIIQELLNNCLKHADASEITIELRKSKYIYVTVTDNGRGFSPEKKEGLADGSGLMSIKNRLVHYGGVLLITSQPGQGTVVSIKIDENYI